MAKYVQHYIRLSGIDIDGVTDALQILPLDQAMGRVIPFDESIPVGDV